MSSLSKKESEIVMSMSQFVRSELDPERIVRAEITRWDNGRCQICSDQLAVEEPIEVRIAQQSLAVIMRTPGNDQELTLGFLFSEGVIEGLADVLSLALAVDEDGLPLPNVINVVLCPTAQQELSCSLAALAERRFAVSTSCGLCGKSSIATLLQTTAPLDADQVRIPSQALYKMAAQLRTQQTIFSYTGGLHAAGLFSPDGALLLLREDVGRHNAVDKLIGYGILQATYPYKEHILLVSGRTSFEIVQKALRARIPCVAAISAPSSLAVELAEECGITLIGFLRDHTMNVYTHPERIV